MPNKKQESNIRDLWDNIKHATFHVTEVPEEGGESKNVSELIMTENLPNLRKEVDIQVKEVQRVLDKMNSNRSTPSHIIFKT